MILEDDLTQMEGFAFEYFVLEVFKQGFVNFPYRRLFQEKEKKPEGYF